MRVNILHTIIYTCPRMNSNHTLCYTHTSILYLHYLIHSLYTYTLTHIHTYILYIEELLSKQFQAQQKHFTKQIEQKKQQFDIYTSLLYIWLAIFLSIKLDYNTYNWGIIFIPIWLYLALQYYISYYYKYWSVSILYNIQHNIHTPLDLDEPKVQLKHQQAQILSSMSIYTFTICFIPLFIFILLVCRLQVQTAMYSTFIILLPIFIILGCCCCIVYCGLCALSTVDIDSLGSDPEAGGLGGPGTGDVAGGGSGGAQKSGSAADENEVFTPVHGDIYNKNNTNNTSNKQNNTNNTDNIIHIPPPVTAPTSTAAQYGTFDGTTGTPTTGTLPITNSAPAAVSTTGTTTGGGGGAEQQQQPADLLVGVSAQEYNDID